jgi:hypothetical protein
MELLSEKSILSVIEASTLLPGKSFKIGDEIRKVLIDNMSDKDGSATIDPSFFFDCLHRFTYNRRRRFNHTEAKKIVEYTLKQIPFQDKTNRVQDKLARLFDNSALFPYAEALKILEKVLKTMPSLRLDELEIAINLNLPVSDYIKKYYEQNNRLITNPNKLVRLFIIVCSLPEKDTTEEMKTIRNELEKAFEELLEK